MDQVVLAVLSTSDSLTNSIFNFHFGSCSATEKIAVFVPYTAIFSVALQISTFLGILNIKV